VEWVTTFNVTPGGVGEYAPLFLKCKAGLFLFDRARVSFFFLNQPRLFLFSYLKGAPGNIPLSLFSTD